tara:strand:- start:28 stop:537 length:510 start_codon:yes stop_codon:yes gene_type:complete
MSRSSKREPSQKTKGSPEGSSKASKAKAPRKTKAAKAAPRKAGRPSKRTPEVEALIAKALSLGLSFEVAADLAGIHRDTLLDWRRKDEDFSAAIKQSTAQGKMAVAGRLMTLIHGGNVAATIFWLKTRTEEFRELRQDRVADAETVAQELEAAAKAMRGSIQGPGDGFA